MRDLDQVIHSLPLELHNFFLSLIDDDYQILLVGGAVRDWCLLKKKSSDLDFQLHHPSKKIDDYIFDIKQSQLFTSLPFNIFKYQTEYCSVEISPPRQDIYHTPLTFRHSDFSPQFDLQMSIEKSFYRRDFTINSLAFDMKEKKLIDFFDGETHIKHKILATVNPDFSNDPLRLLRAVRFSVQFDLKIDQALKDILVRMDLSQLTSFHFWKESTKAKDIINFWTSLSRYPQLYQLHFAEHDYKLLATFFLQLSDLDLKERVFFSLASINLTDQQLEYFAQIFGKKIFLLNKLCHQIKKLHLPKLRPVEKLISDSTFLDLLNVYNAWDKNAHVLNSKEGQLWLSFFDANHVLADHRLLQFLRSTNEQIAVESLHSIKGTDRQKYKLFYHLNNFLKD